MTSATSGPAASGGPGRLLGRLLVEAGATDERELAAALDEQRRTRERLGVVLERRGTDPEQVARALAVQLRLPYAEPPLRPEPEALALVPRAQALRLRVVPMLVRDRHVAVAMADPLDVSALDDLQFQTGRRVEPQVALCTAIDLALLDAYGDDAVASLLTRLPAPGPGGVAGDGAEDVGALRRASEAAPVVALVDHILTRAAAARASDVHIEPRGSTLLVRQRVDGWLRPMMELPGHTGAATVSRVKIMAGLDIAVKRRPQDGRAAVRVRGREVAVRVSTLPARHGEKLVLRLLDGGSARSLEDVGLDDASPGMRALLGRGHGLILVTGPTGSGKTTTLYAALAALDRERRNILTLEDPVEYHLPGLTQVQVEPKAGLSFAAALRAALRQDPDVIMVGEMRDRETVEVGLSAAMTGHLVLSTLHTIDAPGAVARLGEMGAPQYLVAGGLIGVLAQRLVRRLCTRCRRPVTLSGDALARFGLPRRPADAYEAVGCPRCRDTGYRGRVGIFELLVVDAGIRKLILGGAAADAIREAARAAGCVPLSHDAWRRVRQGLTTVEEVAPLLGLMGDEAPVCPACGGAVRTSFGACPACGHRLERRCACGAALENGWRFCAACGGRVTPDPEPGM
ncbi:MAG TPA: ATPase, T2SS/T4P/T4SS family [Longimicrobiales bacterium]|nr:ATPase, T2SS/T4P/T4SS family [Longimicrobiales bacterium]